MKYSPTLLCAVTAVLAATTAQAEPRAQVRGEMNGELRQALERAVGETDARIENRFQARRRASAAAENAEALLRSEGYYQAVIEEVVEGESPPRAVIIVTPGPRFGLEQPRVDWIEAPPDAATADDALADIQIKPDAPGRAADVIAMEGRVVSGLARRGYPDAAAETRRVVVDHAVLQVQPTYRINAGGLVRLDGVRLETRGPTRPEWVAGLAPWAEGDVYDPDDVAELERRLLETGVYDGVGVALSPRDQTDEAGLRPIIVSLTDRPRRVLEAGVSYSTIEGPGVDALWTWHNRFGRADTLRFLARAAQIDSRLGANLSLPHWRRPGQTFSFGGAAIHESTDAYDRTAVNLNADLRQRFGATSWYSYGLALDGGMYKETRYDPVTRGPVDVERDLVILTARGSAYLDQSNDPLDPRRGWRLSGSVQPTAVTGDDDVYFLRLDAAGTAYLPLQDEGRTVLAARMQVGSLIGAEEFLVPSDRLFYSGGGGSVRGYAYQGVGPRLTDNTPRGGLSLFEASIEVRRDIGERLGAVVFLDGGAVGFQETPDLSNMRYGAGFGVRYRLPFGPIRADVAFPLNKRDGDADFQLYISIGQAF